MRIIGGRRAIGSLAWHWDSLAFAEALAAGLAAYSCLVAGWLVLLYRAGHYRPGQLGAYGRIWWLSYFFRYLPGKVMLLVERARLGALVGIPSGAGAAFAVIETVLAIVAGAWVSLLATAYYAGNKRLAIGLVGGISLLILWLGPGVYRRVIRWQAVHSRYPQLASVALSPRDLLAATPFFVLHYLLVGFSFFLVLRSIHPLPWKQLPELCGIYALSHVVGLATLLSPGGLGVREGTLALQLGKILPAGVSEATAIGIRLWFTLIELISCVGVLALSRPLSSASPQLRTVEKGNSFKRGQP